MHVCVSLWLTCKCCGKCACTDEMKKATWKSGFKRAEQRKAAWQVKNCAVCRGKLQQKYGKTENYAKSYSVQQRCKMRFVFLPLQQCKICNYPFLQSPPITLEATVWWNGLSGIDFSKMCRGRNHNHHPDTAARLCRCDFWRLQRKETEQSDND